MNKLWISISAVVLVGAAALGACSLGTGTTGMPFPTEPAPTSHALFSGQLNAAEVDLGLDAAAHAPTLSSLFIPRPSQTPRPTFTPRPTTTPPLPALPTVYTDPLADVMVYADEMNPNWQIFEPSGMEYDLQATEQVYSGQYAIKAVPKGDFSTLLFAVRPDAEENYPRNQVLAVSFKLYSGEDFIKTDDLAVTVLGSNSFPYYVRNDNSVVNNYDPVFSETRLYYLGVNRDIPPDTWVEVTIWLDDMLYDPIYRYVTGFYIKNDADFRQAFRVDDARLIMNRTP